MTISPGFPQLRRLVRSLKAPDSVSIAHATPATTEAGISTMNQHLNRRNVFAGSAAIALSAGVGVVAADAGRSEGAVERVNRLAMDLSEAMSDWMKEIEERDGRHAWWIALVHPNHLNGNPVSFLNSATDAWPLPDARSADPMIWDLAAKFDAELGKLRSLSAEHDAAESRYFAAVPVRPVLQEMPEELKAMMLEMRIKDFHDPTHPYNVQQAAHMQEFKERKDAYESECESLRKSTGQAKAERVYTAQVSRVCRAAEKVMRYPAGSVAELGVKARVYSQWDGNEEVALDALLADISRMSKATPRATAAGKTLSELERLIEEHVAALAEYDAVTDEDWNSPQSHALGRAVDIKRQALLNYRPASLGEAARKAAFMGSCRTFVEWCDIDRMDLIKAFQM